MVVLFCLQVQKYILFIIIIIIIISIHHIQFCYGGAGYLNHPLDLGSEDMLADPISYLINHLSVIGIYLVGSYIVLFRLNLMIVVVIVTQTVR